MSAQQPRPATLLGVAAWDDYWDSIEREYSGYYDRKGKRISMREWAKATENFEAKRVAQSTIKGFWISTVWLGMDHGFPHFGANGSAYEFEPIIFESMVFTTTAKQIRRFGRASDLYMDRYSTEKQALRGHSDICRMIHSGWRGPK